MKLSYKTVISPNFSFLSTTSLSASTKFQLLWNQFFSHYFTCLEGCGGHTPHQEVSWLRFSVCLQPNKRTNKVSAFMKSVFFITILCVWRAAVATPSTSRSADYVFLFAYNLINVPTKFQLLWNQFFYHYFTCLEGCGGNTPHYYASWRSFRVSSSRN